MDKIPSISEAVYVVMCHYEGSPTLVSIRREVADMVEYIRKPIREEPEGEWKSLRGSRREGFRQKTSDYDYMVWPTNIRVVWDLNRADEYDSNKFHLILMEKFEERPGFTLLRILPSNYFLRQLCFRMNFGLYASSTGFRRKTLFRYFKGTFEHGPCASGMEMNTKYDVVNCLACDIWPSFATSFSLRCQSQSWPPDNVLRDIINSGCHVVPIGLKGSSEEDDEWRFSFSLAEQKLVYCMNHTQFICYALLKSFLKDLLTLKDTNGQPLLCSYFIKTVVFWVIQNNTVIDWNPSSLLSGFWLCFKFLLSSVYHAYLPNFFIPKNNLFIPKILGCSLQLLYERLLEIYSQGILGILHNHQIGYWLIEVICDWQYVLTATESDIISEFEIDHEFFTEIISRDIPDTFCCNGEQWQKTHKHAVNYFLDPNTSRREYFIIRKFISTIIRNSVFYFYLLSVPKDYCNKARFRIVKNCLELLKISRAAGFFTEGIYLVLLFYSIGKTMNAIKYLKMIKRNLTEPYVMYEHIVDEERYIEEVVRLPMNDKMRNAVAQDINLFKNIIKELELEERVTRCRTLNVPPYVMTLMLLVLCNRGDRHKQQEALNELYFVIHDEDGRYITKTRKDIAYQILGICQQICGNHVDALSSYQQSLREIPFHNIKEATYTRIQDVLSRNLFS